MKLRSCVCATEHCCSEAKKCLIPSYVRLQNSITYFDVAVGDLREQWRIESTEWPGNLYHPACIITSSLAMLVTRWCIKSNLDVSLCVRACVCR